MSQSHYERVPGTEEDAPPIPNSPPPSFRSRASSPSFPSRASSPARNNEVDQELADTFAADGPDNDNENDDVRQRLVREASWASASASASTTPPCTDQARSGTATAPAQNAAPDRRNQRNNRRSTFVPTAVYGGGTESDGVFTNLSAKPDTGEKLEEHPPTYEQAAADAAPPYWETTILAPGQGGLDDIYIDGLPVGSLFSFVWNAIISMSFLLVGFLLTYLLHTTHAAKNGSRAGLGVTLVHYGFSVKAARNSHPTPTNAAGEPVYGQPPDPGAHDFDPQKVANTAAAAAAGANKSVWAAIANSEWIAYGLMILGWFIVIRAVSDFVRARRHERLVLQSPDRGLPVPIIASEEETERVV